MLYGGLLNTIAFLLAWKGTHSQLQPTRPSVIRMGLVPSGYLQSFTLPLSDRRQAPRDTTGKGPLTSVLEEVWETERHSGTQDDLSHRTTSLCPCLSLTNKGLASYNQRFALGPVILRN